jgi:actin-like ATPase involved in cell morphogenesis
MARIGADVGTFNLVCCVRNDKKDFVYKREVNAFIEMPLENDFVVNMMRKAGVPLIIREDADVAYALGEAAVKMAYSMHGVELRRPMKDGCVNPKEKDAFQIMNIMIHSLVGNIPDDQSILYYCVPSNAVNAETDAAYHGKIIEAIFKAYKSDKGHIVRAYPINEALAIIYAELAEKNYTGIGISFGGGMVNVCFAIFGAPVFSFAIVNSGDWIDKQAARATNESIVFINQEKEKIDLTLPPTNLVERAIQTQYRLMIENTVAGIKKGLDENKKAVAGKPIDIIIAGGTSSPPGFTDLFKEVLSSANLPIDIGEVRKPSDPLYVVSRGCLAAAENHSK